MGPMGPSGPMGPVGQPGGSGPPVCISYQHRLLIVIFISLIRNICVPHSMLFFCSKCLFAALRLS